MHDQDSVCVDCHLKPIEIDFCHPKYNNFSFVSSLPGKILLPRAFSEDRLFDADRIVLVYKLDDGEIKEKNKLWRSHFDYDIYPTHIEEMVAYLFDDLPDMPDDMRKHGAIISKTIKKDAVQELDWRNLSMPNSYVNESINCKDKELEYKILNRIKYCLVKGIQYLSDPIANALQLKYIQAFSC